MGGKNHTAFLLISTLRHIVYEYTLIHNMHLSASIFGLKENEKLSYAAQHIYGLF